MTIILTFVVNSGLNLVLGLIVAKFLGPEEFGRYAVVAAVAVVIQVMLLDWIKLSALRFYSERTRASEPAVRSTLDVLHVSISAGFIAIGAATIAVGWHSAAPAALVAATVGMAIFGFLFDYHTALARARFREGAFAVLVIVKNVAALVLMAGSAFLFQSATLVLVGFCLSVAASIAIAWRGLADPGLSLRLADRRLALAFARYGSPLVIAVTFYSLIPLANRAAVASSFGFAEAGYFSLAADLGVRIFAVAGSALDIMLFQIAVRIEETRGRQDAEQQVRRNAAIVLAVLLPGAAGYWLVLPSFEALFVPVSFRGAFATYTTFLVPGMLAFGIIQFAINPVFQIAKRTAPVIAAALVALVVNGGLLFVLPQHFGGPGFALAQTGGMLAALVVAFALASRVARLMPSPRDIALIVAATAVMTVALAPLREQSPHDLVLPAIVILGAVIYVGMIAAFDVAGLRSTLASKLAARRSRPA